MAGDAAWPGETARGRRADRLRERTPRNDSLSGVYREGLADRQWPNRGDLQNPDRASERIRHALGGEQRGSHHGPGGIVPKRPMEELLANPFAISGLRMPE